jgi:hypothetical protein
LEKPPSVNEDEERRGGGPVAIDGRRLSLRSKLGWECEFEFISHSLPTTTEPLRNAGEVH